MNRPEDVSGLVEEYRALVEATDSYDALRNALIVDSEWTACGATHVLQLARNYGAFVLRNALAVALALEIHDGELGL
jgi:hypothetical protein